MATEEYVTYRKRYGRPQGLLFSDNQGTVVNNMFVPDGDEFSNFIVLTDDNRAEIDMSSKRIEQRKRTINGRMRSYHISNKKSLSVSWKMIPSRAFLDKGGASVVQASPAGLFEQDANGCDIYTTDGGAAGTEMLSWYEGHTGSFWVYFAYDNQTELSDGLSKYNERLEMFFQDFSFNVVNRGPYFDYWNVSLKLEEA